LENTSSYMISIAVPLLSKKCLHALYGGLETQIWTSECFWNILSTK
jgi:hypothetical protein